jgi:hypothetical protein
MESLLKTNCARFFSALRLLPGIERETEYLFRELRVIQEIRPNAAQAGVVCALAGPDPRPSTNGLVRQGWRHL